MTRISDVLDLVTHPLLVGATTSMGSTYWHDASYETTTMVCAIVSAAFAKLTVQHMTYPMMERESSRWLYLVPISIIVNASMTNGISHQVGGQLTAYAATGSFLICCIFELGRFHAERASLLKTIEDVQILHQPEDSNDQALNDAMPEQAPTYKERMLRIFQLEKILT